MGNRTIPPQSDLKQLFDYDPVTGIATWKTRTIGFINVKDDPKLAEETLRKWNTRLAGKVFGAKDPSGYLKGNLLGKQFWLHRLIWKWMTGEDALTIDHHDGNRSNNAWSNLRDTTQTENMRNRRVGVRNTSGVMGVSYVKSRSTWETYIGSGKTRIRLGYFSELAEAVSVRKASEAKLGYHPLHGRK